MRKDVTLMDNLCFLKNFQQAEQPCSWISSKSEMLHNFTLFLADCLRIAVGRGFAETGNTFKLALNTSSETEKLTAMRGLIHTPHCCHHVGTKPLFLYVRNFGWDYIDFRLYSFGLWKPLPCNLGVKYNLEVIAVVELPVDQQTGMTVSCSCLFE